MSFPFSPFRIKVFFLLLEEEKNYFGIYSQCIVKANNKVDTIEPKIIVNILNL